MDLLAGGATLREVEFVAPRRKGPLAASRDEFSRFVVLNPEDEVRARGIRAVVSSRRPIHRRPSARVQCRCMARGAAPCVCTSRSPIAAIDALWAFDRHAYQPRAARSVPFAPQMKPTKGLAKPSAAGPAKPAKAAAPAMDARWHAVTLPVRAILGREWCLESLRTRMCAKASAVCIVSNEGGVVGVVIGIA